MKKTQIALYFVIELKDIDKMCILHCILLRTCTLQKNKQRYADQTRCTCVGVRLCESDTNLRVLEYDYSKVKVIRRDSQKSEYHESVNGLVLLIRVGKSIQLKWVLKHNFA